MVELHREGSAPAACAAGLFLSFVARFFLRVTIERHFNKKYIKELKTQVKKITIGQNML